MATFRCSKCGCDDDTALCNYWCARVRDILPVCSACDPKIGKWHGQFPRLFGAFLVTPSPTRSPREVLPSLVGRLRLAEVGLNDKMTDSSRQARKGVVAPPGGMFYFDDPVPWYKPLAAPPMRGAPVTWAAGQPGRGRQADPAT
jgi:hypothetical protein